MSEENKDLPTVRIQAKDTFSQPLTEMAGALKRTGDEDLAKLLLQDKARLKVNVKKGVDKLANDEVSDAIDLIEDREYKSKSGYHGNGDLRNSVAKHTSKNGMQSDVYANVQSKDGYQYAKAFEYGLKSKDYPAQHVMKDSGEALDETKYDDEILGNSIK